MGEIRTGRWCRIDRLYNEASRRDVCQRAAFLDEACAGDPELRREVESLLAYETAADRFLERSALEEISTTSVDDENPLVSGQQIGGYEIVSLLGAGGMGEVYRARDVRLGREVALKVLSPSIAVDPGYLRRFEEEARSASVLNHPNIVTIYGVGEDGDIAFIAMELVQGRTLRDQMVGGVFSVTLTVDLAVQLGSALGAAHAAGVVHRDLKPENIMITPDGVLKVLDFGIAKREGSATLPESLGRNLADTRTALTEHGVVLGTAGYMSPEQASGAPAGFASDQFSFGAILYEMLSGRRAFERDTKVATLAAIIHAEPDPIEQLNPEVTAPLRQIIERCLAKNPSDRYHLTQDLVLDLRRFRDQWTRGQTVVSEPARLLTRRRAIWYGGTAAAIAAIALLTWPLWSRHSVIGSLAVLPFANGANDRDADYLCDGITEGLIHRISRLPIKVMAHSTVSNFKNKVIDPRAAGKQLGVEAVVTGKVTPRGDRLTIVAELVDVATGASLWGKTYDQSRRDVLNIQDEIATGIVDEGLHLHPRTEERRQLARHPTPDPDVYDLFLKARHFQMGNTEEDYLAARELLQRVVARDPNFADAVVALAGTYWTMALDGYEKPIEAWPEVHRYVQQALALDENLPDAHFGAAVTAFFFDWNWAGAEREFEIAARAPDGDISAELLMAYAFEPWALGRPDESVRLAQRARRIDGLSPSLMSAEADYLFKAGRFDLAIAGYDQAIRSAPTDSRPYFGLAEVRRAQGRFDDAIALRRKAHELEGDGMQPDLFSTTGSAAAYTQIEKAAARFDLKGIERRRARGGYTSPMDFARAYARLGDTQKALAALDAAFDHRAPGLVFLNVDRVWDAIRNDPRFRAAVRRVGLS